MEKVLLFGGTGHLGKKIAVELKQQNYQATAVVRNHVKADELNNLVDGCIISDVTKAEELKGICDGFEIVISSLGKSVSPKDKSKPTFFDIDYKANLNILSEVRTVKVKKFVYVSAFGAEKNQHLAYFKTHLDFSEEVIKSGLDYSIIKPPAIFSSFLDLIEMAKKGRLMNLGAGDKITNPIYEGDLAKICVDSIKQSNAVIEAGGKETLSRRQINETIQQIVAPDKKVYSVPVIIFKMALPLIKLFDQNLFDKLAFFIEVTQHDTLAPKIGEMRLENYVKQNYKPL